MAPPAGGEARVSNTPSWFVSKASSRPSPVVSNPSTACGCGRRLAMGAPAQPVGSGRAAYNPAPVLLLTVAVYGSGPPDTASGVTMCLMIDPVSPGRHRGSVGMSVSWRGAWIHPGCQLGGRLAIGVRPSCPQSSFCSSSQVRLLTGLLPGRLLMVCYCLSTAKYYSAILSTRSNPLEIVLIRACLYRYSCTQLYGPDACAGFTLNPA